LERFLDVRVRRNIVVRDAETLACYDANRAYFEGRQFEAVKAQIVLRLKEIETERAIESLVASLEKRASVRYTPGFEPPPREPEEGGFFCPATQKPKSETAP